jgi:hypothetical protein
MRTGVSLVEGPGLVQPPRPAPTTPTSNKEVTVRRLKGRGVKRVMLVKAKAAGNGFWERFQGRFSGAEKSVRAPNLNWLTGPG